MLFQKTSSFSIPGQFQKTFEIVKKIYPSQFQITATSEVCGGQRINQHGSVEEIFADGFVAWRGEFIFCWIFNWDMVMPMNANWGFYFETSCFLILRLIY